MSERSDRAASLGLDAATLWFPGVAATIVGVAYVSTMTGEETLFSMNSAAPRWSYEWFQQGARIAVYGAPFAPLALLSAIVGVARFRAGRGAPGALPASRPWLAVGMALGTLVLLGVVLASPATLNGGVTAMIGAGVWMMLPGAGRRIVNWSLVMLALYVALTIATGQDSTLAYVAFTLAFSALLPLAPGLAAFGCAVLLDRSRLPDAEGTDAVDLAVQRSRWGFAAFVTAAAFAAHVALVFAQQ